MPEFAPNIVAVVTGGASGIGLGSARVLLASGVKSVALLDISPEVKDVAAKLTSEFAGSTILDVVIDVCKEGEVGDAFVKIVEKFNRVDFLVNAAGTSGTQNTTANTELAEAESVWDVNMKGLWLVERAFIRQLQKQELRDAVGVGLPLKTRGALVNVGSLSSNIAIPNLAPYVMTKHAVLGLTKADAVDYAKEGIRANCVAVGCVKTKITQALWEESSPAKAIGDMFVSRAPMNRWAEPEEVGHVIAFLLSDAASFVTGSCVNVDGGYCAM